MMMAALAVLAFAFCAAAIPLLARFAPAWGLVDIPGGRKTHQAPVPLVGGLGIFAAVLATSALFGTSQHLVVLLLALGIVVAAGVWDDRSDLRPRVKVAAQAAACALMIWGAGIHLTTVGNLVGTHAIGLWIFAVPMTFVAIVGVLNAVNMVDGIDGLAGTLSAIAFGWYALVAVQSGLASQLALAVTFCAAIGGFLVFNLRRPRATVFLGDAGSLMVGFALGWFAIDLTQGAGRTFPPIAALWVLLLPLADCVSLFIRRTQARQSPFVADRRHIHHYLLARGFTPRQVLATLALVSAAFGAVGYFGWRLAVPEPALFWPFFFGFFAYHVAMTRAWARLERRGMAPEAAARDPGAYEPS